MGALLALAARIEAWVYGGAAALALLSLIVFWSALRRLERTPFGLEKDAARRRQNAALAGLIVAAGAAVGVFAANRYAAAPAGAPSSAGPAAAAEATAPPTSTPILGAGPVVVDSSGCQNPNVTLVKPTAGETLLGGYEVRGTANIPNFAFYKVEISGAATSGAWVTLVVGNVPQPGGVLGTFDTQPYQPGEYAFRLVVTDNVGQPAPACVIVVVFQAPAATAAP